MHHSEIKADVRKLIADGTVLPAHPLALDANRALDVRHQRALTRYYLAAGAGGLAVGVHTTQFAIREASVSLFEPVLALASEEMARADTARKVPVARIGGICGPTAQAVREARRVRDHGYHAGLLSLAALGRSADDELLAHCRSVSDVLPVVGFYLQPSVGGRPLSYAFWRRFAELPGVVAIKIAPFNRYQTLDVMRAIAESGRQDITLYTGNDDNIVGDLITPFRFAVGERTVTRRIVGGLLGHWAVWTHAAVQLLEECHRVGDAVPRELLLRGMEVTDSNAAFFDAAHGFAGCIAGLHAVLWRQGLLASPRCLDPAETLSEGQLEQIDRVSGAYPHLNDDGFVARHLDEWLR